MKLLLSNSQVLLHEIGNNVWKYLEVVRDEGAHLCFKEPPVKIEEEFSCHVSFQESHVFIYAPNRMDFKSTNTFFLHENVLISSNCRTLFFVAAVVDDSFTSG